MIPKASLTLAGIVFLSPDQPNQNDLGMAIVVFVVYLLTEILPFVLTLEANFLQIFTSEFQAKEEKGLLDDQRLSNNTDKDGFNKESALTRQSLMLFDLERGGDNQTNIFDIQLERGKSFMDVTKQKQILEE